MAVATFADIAVLVGAIGLLLYYLGTRGHDYWKKRGVPGPKPIPFFGTNRDLTLFRMCGADFAKKLYFDFPGERFIGLIQVAEPVLMVRDLELAKLVLTKDFPSFHSRGTPRNEKVNPLSAHLFWLAGQRWRQLRQKLTPAFTASKMRRMQPFLLECTQNIPAVLDGPAARREEVDMRDVFARLTTDMIASAAFGLDISSLLNPDEEFRRVGKTAFEAHIGNRIYQVLRAISPKLAGLIPQRLEATRFFLDTVKKTLKFREENNFTRNDFMDMLIELRKKGRIVDETVDLTNDQIIKNIDNDMNMEFTDELMAAQAFVFYGAGFETSSSTMSFCLLELAHNPDIQDAVCREVDEVLAKHGSITYDAVMELNYLEMVVFETLRKYPTVPILWRKASLPWQIPGTDITLPIGSMVWIPVMGIQHDPDIYPDPDRFDPERFTKEARASRHQYAWLPFGEGPRVCIGQRFGLMQTKMGLASVLARYRVLPSPRSPFPVKLQIGNGLLMANPACYVRLSLRQPPGPRTA